MLKLRQVERDKRATCPIVPNKWLRQSLRHLVLNEHRAKSVRYLIYRHHEGGEFMDHVKISNLPIFWLLAGFTVFISALQAFLYIREAKKATKVCKVDPEIPKKAFKIGLISAIGPALGVFIIMVGLASSLHYRSGTDRAHCGDLRSTGLRAGRTVRPGLQHPGACSFLVCHGFKRCRLASFHRSCHTGTGENQR